MAPIDNDDLACLGNEEPGMVEDAKLKEVREASAELKELLEMSEIADTDAFHNFMKTLQGHWLNRAMVALNMRNTDEVRKEFSIRADEVKTIIAAIEKRPMRIQDILNYIKDEQEKRKHKPEDDV